jgi:hypothetical protein
MKSRREHRIIMEKILHEENDLMKERISRKKSKISLHHSINSEDHSLPKSARSVRKRKAAHSVLLPKLNEQHQIQ